MLEIINFALVMGFFIFLLPDLLWGEILAVKGVWFDVKLHNRENGSVTQWSKHTKESPRSWFCCQKVWRR
ncbi:TMhelix containing protein [Vibrio phage 1.193.O._10N.286.52.C6]|nr:TMhelix containing protein [Vibrio phage 1.193.O._10N.286.52.C6]